MHPHIEEYRLYAFAEGELTLRDDERQHLQTCRNCLESYLETTRQIIRSQMPIGTIMMDRPARSSEKRSR